MTGYEQIIAIVLATFLAIFLLIAIIAFILIIKVVKTVQRITSKAEHMANNAEHIGDFLKAAAKPLTIAHALRNVADTLFSRKHKKKH